MSVTLGFCIVFTVVTVLLRVGWSWRNEVADMNDELQMIDRIIEHDVASSLWDMDRDALRAQLASIVEVAGVATVELTMFRDGLAPESMNALRPGAASSPRAPAVHRRLTYASRPGATQVLGELRITGDERVVWQRLRNDVAGILLAELIQSALLAGLIMWMFNRLVTVHVRRIAGHLDAVKPGTLDRLLRLERPAARHDELTSLVTGVNTLQANMSDYLQRQLAAERDLAAHRDRLSELVDAKTAELRAANALLEELVRRDALTGLANRRYFDEMKELEMRRAARSGHPLSVLLCDVDFFKRYNDTYGHAAGDACLRAVAEVMRASFCRAGELPARIGGEEFAVLLPAVGQQQALDDAERLRLALVGQAIPHADSQVATFVTMSIGVAELAEADQGSFDNVLRRADRALYRAKRGGRNRVTASNDADATRTLVG